MFANILSRFWWMILLRGLVAILFGILILGQPGISLLSLVIVFGAFALVDGVSNVVTAWGGRREHEHWWVLFFAGLAGLASVVFGVILISRPGAGALAVLWLIGAYALAYGVLLLLLAIRARLFASRLRQAVAAR